MKTRIIEASNGMNWGKFMLGRLEPEEWSYQTQVHDAFGPLIPQLGWGPEHLWVMDLQTGEGAWFKPGGYAHADLEKHAIWVCLLFEPFLEWLYEQDLTDLQVLPALVQLPEAPAGLYGHRRPGPQVREQALELVKTRWWHRCDPGPGACHAVSEEKLVGLIEALGLPVDDVYDVPIHGDEDDGPPADHVPCPDCGDDPGDWTSHAEWCPRIGTVAQSGPPWEPGPWLIQPPLDFVRTLDRDTWRGRVLHAVICCMAGKCRLSIEPLDDNMVDYLQVVRECVPAERIRNEFETIAKIPVPA